MLLSASVLKRVIAYKGKEESAIHYWLVWSQYIKEACEKDNILLVTYERFCEDPYRLIAAFGLSRDGFRKDAELEVKDYKVQGIRNMNAEQIALLSAKQKEIITTALSEHKELLVYFGYELLG